MGSRMLLLMLAVGLAAAFPAEPEPAPDALGSGIRLLARVYSECSARASTMPCLKTKAVAFLDRALRLPEIPLAESVSLVREENEVGAAGERDGRSMAAAEAELEASLPADDEAKDAALDEMLLERVSRFARSHTLQLKLPQLAPNEIQRSLEEGRGKIKKMGGVLIAGVLAKLAAMIPLAIVFLFLLAGKALIVSKVALLLAGVIALKKLFASRPPPAHHDHHGGGYSSSGLGGGFGGGGGSGGIWAGDRRSVEEYAQGLAYRAHADQVA
ncbi:uncharacterized protein LOC124174165 [Ischnura elegans]|uniref:uncharacterized protein LOC124174165 n=1 Tax=Ischnura elegans TaxID=197161 RepID=UPI001ED893A2|nr:uncharacterized protein LOC124174165 [Ischnura elegans]